MDYQLLGGIASEQPKSALLKKYDDIQENKKSNGIGAANNDFGNIKPMKSMFFDNTNVNEGREGAISPMLTINNNQGQANIFNTNNYSITSTDNKV